MTREQAASLFWCLVPGRSSFCSCFSLAGLYLSVRIRLLVFFLLVFSVIRSSGSIFGLPVSRLPSSVFCLLCAVFCLLSAISMAKQHSTSMNLFIFSCSTSAARLHYLRTYSAEQRRYLNMYFFFSIVHDHSQPFVAPPPPPPPPLSPLSSSSPLSLTSSPVLATKGSHVKVDKNGKFG